MLVKSLPNLKQIIFDLDGTLIDGYRAVYKSLNKAFEAYHYPRMSFQKIKKSVGWGEEALVSKFVKSEDVSKVLSVYRKEHRICLEEGVRVLPGVKRFLLEINRQGLLSAIATNRPSEFTHIILRNTGLAKFFEGVVCADQVKNGKPSPEMINKILSKNKYKASETLYIGDMTIDIQTGRRAGVKTIAVATGSSDLAALKAQNPYFLARKMSEVASFIFDK